MRIGINTRFLLSSKMEGFGWYTFEVVKRMVLAHPEHEFVFFFDRAFDSKFIFAKNVTPVVVFPPARHTILFIWWFNYSIKKALKKHSIDVFFSPDGYVCLNTMIPQVAVIHDLNFEHYPEDVPAFPRWYLRHYFPKFARKATRLITVSHYSKADIVKTYGISENKITVAWNGASDLFKPIPEEEKAVFKKEITAGKNYFVFVGAIHPRKNVKTLLEAFYQFTEFNSTTDFVIVGEQLWKKGTTHLPQPSAEIANRIHFTGHVSLDRLTKIMGAASALVYVPYFEGFGIPLVEAMKCGVPIISGNKTSLPEVAGNAALYVDPFDVEAIVKNMVLLTDNEQLCANLKQKGLERSTIFSWDESSRLAWETIVGAV